MDKKCQFLFDFGSPNAYLAHTRIAGIEQRTGQSVEYVPVLLGGVFKLTNNQSPMQAFGHIENKMRFMGIETDRFLKKHPVPFVSNPHFPVNTLQIMRGAIFAKPEPYFEKYVDAVFRAMWVKQMKMDDPEVIKNLLEDSGLDSDSIIAGMQDSKVKAELIDNTNQAVTRGVFGSPSFFVGDEMFYGKDQLRDFEEEIVNES
jgi:2-hydroxychromene-2-carboxylate isomerase